LLDVANLSVMEDFDPLLEARRPTVACDGVHFYVGYQERRFDSAFGSDEFEACFLSGAVNSSNNSHPSQARASIALAERRVVVDEGAGFQGSLSVATALDGNGPRDVGLLMYEDWSLGTTHASLELRGFESGRPVQSSLQAIGGQYCAANGHADSGYGGRASSFLSVYGPGTVLAQYELRCDHMKHNAFAYFIVSSDVGNVNLAGGGQGRLCLGGAIGRVVGGSILSSGNTGSVTTLFSPLNLPSPTGTFAATPGSTLYFQCWHRDVTPGGAATSNFSNACAVTFR
jgi:hypothetical protein